MMRKKRNIYISVKTQYAGIDVHLFIIHLFRYLNEKYFVDFEMSDEGEYWETNDENVLKKNFKRYTELIDGFASAIQNQPIKGDEDIETYFLRLMKHIKDQKNREE